MSNVNISSNMPPSARCAYGRRAPTTSHVKSQSGPTASTTVAWCFVGWFVWFASHAVAKSGRFLWLRHSENGLASLLPAKIVDRATSARDIGLCCRTPLLWDDRISIAPTAASMIAAALQGGGKSEEEELEELQGMIGGVPRGMFIKLKEAQKNRDLADRVRREKEEIAALRERRAQEQKERMDALRAKREQKHEAAKLAHRNKIVELGNAVRQEVKDLEDMKAHMASEHWKDARVRVEIANGLDAKLDAAELARTSRSRRTRATRGTNGWRIWRSRRRSRMYARAYGTAPLIPCRSCRAANSPRMRMHTHTHTNRPRHFLLFPRLTPCLLSSTHTGV